MTDTLIPNPDTTDTLIPNSDTDDGEIKPSVQVGIPEMQALADLFGAIDFATDGEAMAPTRQTESANLFVTLDAVATGLLTRVVGEVLTGKREYHLPKAVTTAIDPATGKFVFELSNANARTLQSWLRSRLAGKVAENGQDVAADIIVTAPFNQAGKQVATQFVVHLPYRVKKVTSVSQVTGNDTRMTVADLQPVGEPTAPATPVSDPS